MLQNSSNSLFAEDRRRLHSNTLELMEQIKATKEYLSQTIHLVKSLAGVTQKDELVERLQKVYMYLEHITMHDASRLSNSSKANLRRAQAELQKARLSVLNVITPRRLRSSIKAAETVTKQVQ